MICAAIIAGGLLLALLVMVVGGALHSAQCGKRFEELNGACPMCQPHLFDGSLAQVPVAVFCGAHGECGLVWTEVLTTNEHE